MAGSLEHQASEALSQFQLLTGQRDPVVGEGDPGGALAGLGAAFGILTSLEQMISAPLSVLPFPAFPALRVTDMDVGLPHGHTHPPNTPGPPVPPVPFPSTGPIIPIPFLSGATTTLINAMPAARCGDMGLGIWCGGYFPMYEVLLGSSSVWIEGARAGRLLVDVTRHCMFSSPKPSDPPLGPMVGMTVTSSPNVLIGGVPMPSLLDLAMGAVMQGLFKGISKAVKKVKAARAVRMGDDLADFAGSSWTNPNKAARPTSGEMWDQLIDAKFIDGDDLLTRTKNAYDVYSEAVDQVDRLLRERRIIIDSTDPDMIKLVKDDLYHMASNPVGRETLERIQKADTFETTITPGAGKRGRAPGSGASTDVQYDPWVYEADHFPPDSVLHHELVHAANNAEGVNRARRTDSLVQKNGQMTYEQVPPDPAPEWAQPNMTEAERLADAKSQWGNLEEQNVIRNQDNPYREGFNTPVRTGHDWATVPSNPS
jgi:uncharacterized Zn-binding protein involved in type VI secretion